MLEVITINRIDIVIPVHHTADADMVNKLFASLANCADELSEHHCEIIVINDSADDMTINALLLAALEDLQSKGIPFIIESNESSIGYVRSANKGMAMAVSRQHDVFLVHSDVILSPGCIAEVQEVAYLDFMIGFVSPRSNNASICTIPSARGPATGSTEDADVLARFLLAQLPRYQYAPMGLGFCLYIKWPILEEFGLFEERYGRDYSEEGDTDLAMRANRCGYRAALANHAYAYHFGSQDLHRISQESQSTKIAERYPEYPKAIQRYINGPQHRAELLLSALVPDKLGRVDVVFDLSDLRAHFNGTSHLTTQFLRAVGTQWTEHFNIFAMCSSEAGRFHQLDSIEGITLLPPSSSMIFAAGIYLKQPGWTSAQKLSALATVNCFFMLDSIAWDCQYLFSQVDGAWNFVFEYANGVVYLSEFSKAQFHLRFPCHARLQELVSYPSFNPLEYLPRADGEGPPLHEKGEHILVVGNHYHHKFMAPTVDAISHAFPGERIIALGLTSHSNPGITCLSSGNLSEQAIDNLYLHSKAVVYPSHYEGFGLPAVKALSYGKPLFLRDTSLAQELLCRMPNPSKILLYKTTRHLVEILRSFLGGQILIGDDSPNILTSSDGWIRSASEVANFLRLLLADENTGDLCRKRLQEVARLQEVNKQDSYQNSLSWHITAPLRMVGERLMNLGKGKI